MLLLNFIPSLFAQGLVVENLRCEYCTNPLGLDTPKPRLSWILSSSRRAQRQTAYRILVASSRDALAGNRGELWDSGKVASGQSAQIEYEGTPLSSRARCFWKVLVWDKDGTPSDWSAPAQWEMGLLVPEDWQAQWIQQRSPEPRSEEERFNDQPAPLLRKEFTVDKAVARARAYISGLGYYELHLNGKRVGDNVLDPGWTTYSRRVLYSTYDVTAQVARGRNAVGIMLGNGWFNPLPLRMWGQLNLREHLTVGEPRAILQLAIDYVDGSSQIITTDTTWRTCQGPILRNSIYLGEVYDARHEQPGWDGPGFPSANWEPAAPASAPLGALRAQTAPPIRVTRVLRPVNRTQPRPGTWIFDFGQNFAGCVTLRVKGPAGTVVRLRYGELLYPDGTLNAMTSVAGQIKGGGPNYVYSGTGAPKTAWQSDVYTLKGGAEEVYTPWFTFHGLRYAEVTGYPGEPPLEALAGLRLNSAVERAGTFACSNERFNRIQQQIEWTFLANLFSVQSDCPAREKFGYGGDVVATSETFLLNFDMARFYGKTVRDYADAARPNGGLTETAPFVGIADEGLGGGSGPVGWGTAFPQLQWQLYQYYGDRRILEEQYPLTRTWVEFLRARAKDNLLDNGISDHESLVPKPRALTGTAFYYYNVQVLSRIARVLGKTQDAERYAALAGEIKQSFNRRFLKRGTGAYDTATQACQAFALFLDLAPPEERENALQVLVRDLLETHHGHLTTGIFGTRFLPLVLSDCGRTDLACAVVDRGDFPGWGHMLERGATTLWEHWEFSDNTFSHNHPMFGSIGEWFFKALAGLQPDPEMAGRGHFIIRPQPAPNLTWVKGEYRSVRGPVASEWHVAEGNINLRVAIPANMSATVYVPTRDSTAVKESGRPAGEASAVRFLRTEAEAAVYEVGSGDFVFEAPFVPAGAAQLNRH